jgi:hypothetical protein
MAQVVAKAIAALDERPFVDLLEWSVVGAASSPSPARSSPRRPTGLDGAVLPLLPAAFKPRSRRQRGLPG